MRYNENEIMVSIITLAYNHESYIKECLDGIIMQKTNLKYFTTIYLLSPRISILHQ